MSFCGRATAAGTKFLPVQSRPFGVALLIAGVDEKGPQLLVDVTFVLIPREN